MGIEAGQTLWSLNGRTEYRVLETNLFFKGFEHPFVAVQNKNGTRPCLKTSEELTEKAPRHMVVVYKGTSKHYKYLLPDTPVEVGDLIFNSTTFGEAKVVRIEEGTDSYMAPFKGYKLGEKL